MKIINIIIVLYFAMHLASCGAGSTAGDLAVYDLSATSLTETNSEIDDPYITQYGVVTLTWTPPTENTDMTGLNNLAGYKVYYGINKKELIFLLDAGSNVSTIVIENDDRLQTNIKYYFGITAINNLNVESSMSNIVSIDL